MKDVLVRTGSSLLAAALGYIALNVVAEGLSPVVKLAVAAVVGAAAFGIAVWAANDRDEHPPGRLEFASDLTGRNVSIEDIRVKTGSGETKVASNINAQGSIEIKRASVDSSDAEE